MGKLQLKSNLDVDELKSALPRELRGKLNDGVIAHIDKLITHPELEHNFKDNLIGFSSVLREGKYKLTDYINACRYVSHVCLGDKNETAYRKTFPTRYRKLVDSKASDKKISAYVSAYNRTKLVQEILAQRITPASVMFNDVFIEAILESSELMRSSKSDIVRQKAAEVLIRELKPKEDTQINLKIENENTQSHIQDLMEATKRLTEQQMEIIKQGGKLKDIKDIPIVIDNPKAD